MRTQKNKSFEKKKAGDDDGRQDPDPEDAGLVVGSRRFNGAPPVAAKTRFKPTFMVSEQTRPQTRFKPASKPVLMWIWPNDMNVDK